MENLSLGQYELIYNSLSFGIATMGAATLFFWLSRGSVAPQYRAALTITGLVTAIAAYHYFRIFESWGASFDVQSLANVTDLNQIVPVTGEKFNDAYRYVDWLLTVPLLLVELILVMGLARAATISKSVRLGLAATAMIALGYPGEIASDAGQRVLWGVLSMIPFLYILYELFVGLRGSINQQPAAAKGLVGIAVWVTILSWSFYPIVYFAPLFTGAESYALQDLPANAVVIIQVGYTIADIVAKAAFGVLIYMIAAAKSQDWIARQSGGMAAAPAE